MMTKVLVIELPDDADFGASVRTVEAALDELPEGSRVFGAIREDADAVLRVFEAPA